MKLTNPFKRPNVDNDELLDAGLELTRTTLATAKDFMDLAPVPGLGAAVGVLVTIVEKAQVSISTRREGGC